MMPSVTSTVLALEHVATQAVASTTDRMLVAYHFLGGFIVSLLALALLSAGANIWMFRHSLRRALARRRQRKVLGKIVQRTVNVVRSDGTTLPALLMHHDRPGSPLVLDIGDGCLKYVTSNGEFNTKSSLFVKWEEVQQ